MHDQVPTVVRLQVNITAISFVLCTKM
jgi:hypothetical protein